MKKIPPPVVISIGGSLVAPASGIDVPYLKTFRAMILRRLKKGERFIIVVGGGSTARVYQNAAKEIVRLNPEDVDWLGIHATRMNAHLLRTLFRDVANPLVVKDPTRRVAWYESVLIAAGWKPGWSTDYIAVRLAKKFGSHHVINLTNIERVYNKDPRHHADAIPYDAMTWHDFRAIVGDVWNPGANAPFDPIASRLAHRSGIHVSIANGMDLTNVTRILDGRSFVGTKLGEHATMKHV